MINASRKLEEVFLTLYTSDRGVYKSTRSYREIM